MKAPCTFVLQHFLSRIRSTSYCVFLQRIAEMNLESTCEQSFGTGANRLTTEQILLSSAFEDHFAQRIAYGLRCSSQISEYRMGSLKILRGQLRSGLKLVNRTSAFPLSKIAVQKEHLASSLLHLTESTKPVSEVS